YTHTLVANAAIAILVQPLQPFGMPGGDFRPQGLDLGIAELAVTVGVDLLEHAALESRATARRPIGARAATHSCARTAAGTGSGAVASATSTLDRLPSSGLFGLVELAVLVFIKSLQQTLLQCRALLQRGIERGGTLAIAELAVTVGVEPLKHVLPGLRVAGRWGGLLGVRTPPGTAAALLSEYDTA